MGCSCFGLQLWGGVVLFRSPLVVAELVAGVLWSMTSASPLDSRNDLQLIMAPASGRGRGGPAPPSPVFLPRRPLGRHGDEDSAFLSCTPWLDALALELPQLGFAFPQPPGVALASGPALVSGLALESGLALVSGPTEVSDFALTSRLALAPGLALVSGLPLAPGLALSLGLALASDLALAPGLVPLVVVVGVEDVLLRVARPCPAIRVVPGTRIP